MLYLFWSILNVAIQFYFIYLIFGFIIKGKRIFNPKFKSISVAIVIVEYYKLYQKQIHIEKIIL